MNNPFATEKLPATIFESSLEEFFDNYQQKRIQLGIGMPPDPALAYDLIAEELDELQKAIKEKSIVKLADAYGDLLYVVVWGHVACNLPMIPLFQEIHRSNMSKLWTYNELKKHTDPIFGETNEVNGPQEFLFEAHEEMTYQLVNHDINIYHCRDVRAYIVKRKNGKVVKSPSYSSAHIVKVLGLNMAC